ncbi:unnamed protein product [Pedinophyceae sp. YPF-701]|nr:unnamed protein product [Pedinophyceae sp. YPF-701]
MHIDQPPIHLEEGWKLIEETIQKIQRNLEGDPNESPINTTQWSLTYTRVYNLCTQKPPHDYSDQLYLRYGQVFKEYIRDKVMPALEKDFESDEDFLNEMIGRWRNHTNMTRMMAKFFDYLDRYYIKRHQLDKLQIVPMKIFCEQVYGHIKERARTAMLTRVALERDGEVIDKSAIRAMVDIFIQMGMDSMDHYENDFERELLNQTAAYYKLKAADWLETSSTPGYLEKAEEYLRQEEQRVDSYLHHSSKVKILGKVQAELLEANCLALLEKEGSGLTVLLRDDRQADLQRMFRLFKRIGDKGLDPMARVFKRHVETQGVNLVLQASQAVEQRQADAKGKAARDAAAAVEQGLVRSVIALHRQYHGYVSECFEGHQALRRAMKDAFEVFCNRKVDGATFAELMAKYCDVVLRKGGGEKMSDAEIEEQLRNVVQLMDFVSDKDIFGEFYRKQLSNRLLQDKSTSDDLERVVLTRLKEECGHQFTSKMEGMLKDLQLAREKQQEFEDWRRTTGREGGVQLGVQVLTTGFWPNSDSALGNSGQQREEMTLPRELAACVDTYKEFFTNSRQGAHRKLEWRHGMGTATVKAHFGGRSYDLVVKTAQCVVLCLLGDAEGERLSYAQIKTGSGMADDDLERTLHSLACAKYKLLCKTGHEKRIGRDDEFWVNDGFKDKMKRIRVPLAVPEDRKRAIKEVESDRKPAIQAAIVRTMKARKVYPHNELVVEVSSQLAKMFRPDMKAIKQAIEQLIEKAYLERDKDNNNLFRYVA